ncbi:MAG: hypothetical protein IM613_12495 [Cytophagales bacterium]|nr:hypothetical protein [Cytophagales bacterium]
MELVYPQLLKSHGEHIRLPYAYKRYSSGRLGAYFIEIICYDEDRPTSRPYFLWGFALFRKEDESVVQRERVRFWSPNNWWIQVKTGDVSDSKRYDPVFLYRRAFQLAKYWYKVYAGRGYYIEKKDAWQLEPPEIKKPTSMYLGYEVKTGYPVCILEAYNNKEALVLFKKQYKTKGTQVNTRLLDRCVDYYLQNPKYSKMMRQLLT